MTVLLKSVTKFITVSHNIKFYLQIQSLQFGWELFCYCDFRGFMKTPRNIGMDSGLKNNIYHKNVMDCTFYPPDFQVFLIQSLNVTNR